MKILLNNLYHVILSEARNLYDCLRDPHLHCIRSAVQGSLALRAICLLTVAASALLGTNQAQAQSGIEIESGATYQFGEQITFSAQLKNPVQIQQANIIILIEAQGVTQVQPIEFNAGRAEYRFDTRQNRVRPFSIVRWYFELTLSDGSKVQSDPYSMRYDDNRFQWQKLEAGPLRVMWVQGDATFGQNAMNAAQSGLRGIENILPVDLTQPVDIYIYASQSDFAALGVETWAAGHADPALGVVLVVIEPESSQSLNMDQRIPHELMHVMLYREIGAGYDHLPFWLSEGMATLAEINPSPDYENVLLTTSARTELIPLRDLCASFPSEPDQVFLAYAEARSFTTYLRDRYGAPALLNLAKVYAEGVDCENGAERALGASLSQLDSNWRDTALGQNTLRLVLRNMLPYLVILGLIIFIPILSGLSAARQKANQHGPEKPVNKR